MDLLPRAQRMPAYKVNISSLILPYPPFSLLLLPSSLPSPLSPLPSPLSPLPSPLSPLPSPLSPLPSPLSPLPSPLSLSPYLMCTTDFELLSFTYPSGLQPIIDTQTTNWWEDFCKLFAEQKIWEKCRLDLSDVCLEHVLL